MRLLLSFLNTLLQIRELSNRHFLLGVGHSGFLVSSFLQLRLVLSGHCLQALIHLLRSEGVEFGDQPIPPKDTRKRPKGFKAVKPEDDPDWIEYL